MNGNSKNGSPLIYMGVKNLRILRKTPLIPLRPIMLLLGRNSAGKSTFLRSMLLIRQSLQAKSSAPILWFGEHVDFGDFESAVTNNNLSDEIVFSFRIKNLGLDENGLDAFASKRNFRVESIKFIDELFIDYHISGNGDETFRSKIVVKVPSESIDCSVVFENGKFVRFSSEHDGHLDIHREDFKVNFFSAHIFSDPVFTTRRRPDSSYRFRIVSRRLEILKAIAKLLKPKVRSNLSRLTILEESGRIISYSNMSYEALHSLSHARTVSFQKFYANMLNKIDGDVVKSINLYCKLRRVMDLIEGAGGALSFYFLNFGYIEPARVRTERYYRLQELSVSQIDSDGRNLPMFLAALRKQGLRDFSDWVRGIFGYGVDIKRTRGHISIEMISNKKSVNITDTGYGVSQLLPILAQVWSAMDANWRKNRRRAVYKGGSITLAIEQPELHLHPAHQALLADVFSSSSSAGGDGGRADGNSFVIETHSEALVNRFGELVSSGQVLSSEIEIVIFDLDDIGDLRVSISNYDNNGVLENWPFGFFNYD